MSSAATLLTLVRPRYPERPETDAEGRLDELGDRIGGSLVRAARAFRVLHSGFPARVRACEAEFAGLDAGALRERAREVGKLLRRDGFAPPLAARAFALISTAADRMLGMRPFDVQLLGGWVMLRGMLAEMETGEGKTLTATLPACAAALAGVHVHVITVNDYLVTRDARLMRPVYECLGLTVGTVLEEQSPPERQAAYGANVTYGTNKSIVFDYLRDRITLGQRSSALRLQVETLGGEQARVRKLLLRRLSFAIVDEADSVLIDEARTPLIISGPSQQDTAIYPRFAAPSGEADEARVAEEGLGIARALDEGEHYTVMRDERRVLLTDEGRRRVEALCADLGGVWAGLMRREELATQALAALHLFSRDEHYLVREGKVEIIDEYTGRTMPDRSWERGLHQLVEAKEGCEVTAQKEPLARISYQRFFRRYLHLCGMTGTAKEVSGELGAVYGLPVARVPTHRPSARKLLPGRVEATEDAKWAAIARRVQAVHSLGRPVLLGTRSVAASERASRALDTLGLEHRVLNAKQDEEEAEIVSRAGEAGRITIATNMAGRGTDIKLAEGVAALGGLHVILSERHDSARIDRQLAGRCARQGDPGHYEEILSLEDSIMAMAGGPIGLPVALLAKAMPAAFGARALQVAQRRAEKAHSRIRKALLKMDQKMGKTLAFSGSSE